MRDLAKEAYEKIGIGETGWMRPDPSRGETLASFQAVALAADSMQQDGLILIRSIHKESMSGDSVIDAIQFTRLR
jgi:hypothetical protein